MVDAPPLPTSKDQCKNGGWRTYGVFKNQGDCVSFVATKGRTSRPAPSADIPAGSTGRAMSQENMDIIRRAYVDLNRRDVDAWLGAFHQNAEMYDLAGGPEGPARQGHAALREWVEAMDEIWEGGRHKRRSSSTPVTL